MLEPERLDLIGRLLKQRKIISTHELCQQTGASEATVRRDLTKLEGEGLVRRVHGGAELPQTQEEGAAGHRELPLAYRKEYRLGEKRNIARYAAALCNSSDTIIIDGGSTTFQMAEFLADTGCRVITNSFAIAEELLKHGKSEVIIPGGIVYPDSGLILDPFQADFFANYAAHKVFIGAGGIGPQGLTNRNPDLIKAERMMIARAEEVIILADSGKFEITAPLVLCGLESISMLITDTGISAKQALMLETAGVPVVTV